MTFTAYVTCVREKLLGQVQLLMVVLLSLTGSVHSQDFHFQHTLLDEMGPVDPWGKSAGDLDGDGLPDLLVGGSKSGGLVAYVNPSWKPMQLASQDRWSTDHEVVDLDGDGDQDVVALTLKELCWLENPGWTIRRIQPIVLHDIEVADFDGDGNMDVVGRDQGEFGHRGDLLHFFYQRSEGAEWQREELSCLDGEGLATADMDRDGDIDVVLNSIWFENESALGQPRWRRREYGLQWDHGSAFVALADINSDGRRDIVLAPSELAGSRYRLSWFEAPRESSSDLWKEHPVANDIEAVCHFVGVADFDLDGQLDIVSAEMEQGMDPDELTVYENLGQGRNWRPQVIATGGSHSMRVLDVDGDGDADLFGANWRGRRVDLWTNQAADNQSKRDTASWVPMEIDLSREHRSFGIATGDIDGDGTTDIAAGSYVYRNPGALVDRPWPRSELSKSVDINFVVELPSVGTKGERSAVMLAQSLPDLQLIRWNARDDTMSTTTILEGLNQTGHGSSQGFALDDINGDQEPDWIVATGNGLDVLLNPGTSSRIWEQLHITNQSPEEGVATGDIDGDGDVDIVAWFGTGSGSNELGWWRHPGNSHEAWTYATIGSVTGAEGDRICVGDFNRDGKLDVAATGTTNQETGSGVYYFEQRPAGRWQRHTVGNNLGAMNSMSVGDIDRDGLMDIVTGEHRGKKRIVVWRNRDLGRQWSPAVIDTGKESHLGVHLSDLDQDGDLDLLTIGWDDYQHLRLWRNDQLPAKTP